jgi:lipoprotein-anchoring transpeptidase ErfK/SrfK
MSIRSATITLSALAVLATGSVPGLAGEAAAQQASPRLAVLSHPEVSASAVVARDDYLVVIDLDENELHFMRGREVLWSAPVGTGMGLRLESGDRRWTFSTPTGEFQVMYKEENPVWVAPDWFFIENKLPVPPTNDPRRRFPGALGVAAVHFGSGLAIHGTDKPDLLGQRVSHGCIRIANEYALRLYHNVQVGTKILIVGTQEQGERGQLIPGNVPGAGPVDARTQRMRDRVKAERDRLTRDLAALSTAALLDRLEEEMAERTARTAAPKWPETASVLIGRAVRDGDLDAAQGLLERVSAARDARLRVEYLTFVADLHRRAPLLTVEALGRMERRAQRAAAAAIVEGTMGLFAGGAAAATAPWPTGRVLRTALEGEARSGWDILQSAEQGYRERFAGAGNRVRTERTGRL